MVFERGEVQSGVEWAVNHTEIIYNIITFQSHITPEVGCVYCIVLRHPSISEEQEEGYDYEQAKTFAAINWRKLIICLKASPQSNAGELTLHSHATLHMACVQQKLITCNFTPINSEFLLGKSGPRVHKHGCSQYQQEITQTNGQTHYETTFHSNVYKLYRGMIIRTHLTSL